MSGILFPDLAAAFGAAEATSASKAQRDYINEDRETGKYFGAALKGDPDAQARVMTNPRYASALSSQLERIEVGKRARVKEDADYITTSGMAILNAPADQQPGLYARVRQEAAAKGRDVSTWPTQYDPSWVKFNVDKAMPVSEYYKRNGEGVQYVEPGGGGATPGGFTGQVAKDESGGNYNIPNAKGSGAYGKYQFMPDTWASVSQANPQLNLPMNMRQATPQQQEAAMEAFTRSNGQALVQAGQPATPANLYLAHRFGTQGATKFLSTPDNTPIAQVFPANWIQQNPDLNTTVGQFKRSVQSRYGGMPVGREVDIATNAAPMPEPPPGMAVPGNPAPMPGGPSGAPPGMAVGDTQPPRADASGNALPPQGQEIPREATKGVQLPPGYKIGTQGGKIFSPVPGYIQVMPPGGGAPILWPVPKASEAAPAGYRYAPDGRTLQVIPGGPADKPQGSGPFTGKSPEAEGLNMLVATGVLTARQAAELAAGKTVTDPETKQTIFMTPSGIFGQTPGQAPQPLAGPTPGMAAPQGGAPMPSAGGSPGGVPAPAPANSGAIPLTGTKTTGQPSATEMANLRSARVELEKIATAAERFKTEWKNASLVERARTLSGAPTPLASSYYNFALLAKGDALYKLGVLNGPDLTIIQKTLADPSTWKSLMASDADVIGGVDQAMNIVNTGVSATERQFGIAPAQGAPKPPADNAERGRLIFDAQKAIKEGRDPVAVRARLKELNIDPAELDAK